MRERSEREQSAARRESGEKREKREEREGGRERERIRLCRRASDERGRGVEDVGLYQRDWIVRD